MLALIFVLAAWQTGVAAVDTVGTDGTRTGCDGINDDDDDNDQTTI